MKKFILFSLLMVALRLAGQTNYPVDYVPVPTPLWTVPVSQTGHELDLICYDAETGLESTVLPVHYEVNPSLDSQEPYIPPDLPVVNEEAHDQDNFTEMVLIGNPSVFHYSTCVKLYFTFPDGTNWQGSGTLISSCVVITAGHCVFDNNHGGWARSVTVIPGYRDNNRPFGEAYRYRLYSWKGWTESRNFDWDMGVIKIDKPLGNQAGSLGFGHNSDDSFFKNNTFHNLSYPGASPYNGKEMYYCYGNYDDVQTHRLYYNKPSYGGSSGSGTYYKDVNGKRYVYAIHSHTNTNGQSGQTRITSSQFSYIRQIIDEGCNNTGLGVSSINESPDLQIYPNPVTDKLNLHMKEIGQACHISVVDLLGNVVFQSAEIPVEGTMTLSFDDLKTGYYFVTFNDGKQSTTKSFVKISSH